MRDGPLGERLLPPAHSVPTPPVSRRQSMERGICIPQSIGNVQEATPGREGTGGGEDGTYFSRREFFGTPAARQRVIEHHKRKAKSFYGNRTIGEFGSFVYLVNQIFGASLVAIPYVFKASGYIPCLLSNSFTCIVGAFAALMLMRAMTMIKGNYAFQQRVEYAACVAYFLGKKRSGVVQVCFYFAMQAMNIASIVVVSQAIDQLLILFGGYTVGLQVLPSLHFRVYDAEAYAQYSGVDITETPALSSTLLVTSPSLSLFSSISSSLFSPLLHLLGVSLSASSSPPPPPPLYLSITVGYVLCACVCIPLSTCSIEENMVVQYISFAFLLFSIFVMSSCAAAKLSTFPLLQGTATLRAESIQVQNSSLSRFPPLSTSVGNGKTAPFPLYPSVTALPHYSDGRPSDAASRFSTVEDQSFSPEFASAQIPSDTREHGLSFFSASDQSTLPAPGFLSTAASSVSSTPLPGSARHDSSSPPFLSVTPHESVAGPEDREVPSSSSSETQPRIPVSAFLSPGETVSPYPLPIAAKSDSQSVRLSDQGPPTQTSAFLTPPRDDSLTSPKILAVPPNPALAFAGTVNVPGERISSSTISSTSSPSSFQAFDTGIRNTAVTHERTGDEASSRFTSSSLLAVEEANIDNLAAAGWARAAVQTGEVMKDLEEERNRIFERGSWTGGAADRAGGYRGSLRSDRREFETIPLVRGRDQQRRREEGEGESLLSSHNDEENGSSSAYPSSIPFSVSSQASSLRPRWSYTDISAGSRPSRLSRTGEDAHSGQKFFSLSDNHSLRSPSGEPGTRDETKSKLDTATANESVYWETGDSASLLRSSLYMSLDKPSALERDHPVLFSGAYHKTREEGSAAWPERHSTASSLLSLQEERRTHPSEEKEAAGRKQKQRGPQESPQEDRTREERKRAPSPFGDRKFGQLFSTFIAAYSYVTVVPCWANEMTAEVRVERAVWVSSTFCCMIYFLFGLLLSAAYPSLNSDNILQEMLRDPTTPPVARFAVYVFDLFTILPGILVYCIATRYNLVNSGFCTKRNAFWLGVIAPFGISWLLMNDVYFSGLFTWSSLFFSLMCNFIAPIGVYILACTKIPPLQRNLQGKRGKILFNPQLRRNVQGLGGGQRTAEQVRLSLLQWLRSTLKDEARTGECDPQLLHLLLSPSTPSSAAQLDSGAPGNGESSPYEDGGTDILDSLTHHRSAWLREEAATAAVAAAALQIRDGFLPAGPYRKPRSPLSSLGGSLSILPSSDDSGTTGSAGSAGENSPRASFASPTPFSPKSHGHSQHLSPASSIQTLPGDLRSSSSSQLPLCSRSHSLVSGHSAKASTAEELPSARRAASMTHSDKRRTRRHSFKSFLSVDRGKGKLSYTSSPSDGGSSTPSLAPPGGLSREEEFNQNTRTDEAMGSPLHRTWDRAALDEVGLRLKQLAASGQEGEERGEEEEEERGGDSRISRDRVAGSPVSHSPSTLSVSKGGDMGTSGNRANDGRTHPGNGFGSPPRRRATGSSTGSRETSDGRRYLKECLPYPTPYREESEYHHTLSKEDSRALGRDGCFPVPSVGSRNARMLRFHPGYTTARAAEEERGGLGGEVNLYRHSSPSESEEEVAECVSRDVDDDAAAIRAQLQLPQLLLLHADEVEKNVWLLPPEYEDQSVSVKREDSRSEGWNGGEERRGGVGGYAQPGEYSWQHESGQETSEGIGQTGEPSGEQRRPEGGLLEENKTLEILSSAQAAAREKTSRGRRTARWSPTDKAVAFHDETLETKALFHPESRRLEPGETVTSESEEASHTFQGDSHRRKQTFSGATVPLARRGGHAQGSRVSDTTVAEVSPRSHVPATSEFVSPLSGDVRSSSRSGSDFAGSASHASFSLPPGAEAGAGTAPKDASLNEGMSFAENAGFRSSYGRRRSRRLDSSVRASSAGSFSFSNPPSFWHSSTSVHTTAPLVSLSSALSCPLSAPVDRTIRSAPRRPPESGHKFDRAQSCGGPGAFGWARSMTPDPSSLLPRSGGHKLLSATSGHFASSHTCGGGAGSSRLLPREDSVERLGIGKLGKEVLLRQQRQWLAAQQASSASRQRRLLSRRHTLSGRLLGGFSRQVSSFPLRRGRTGLDETFSSRRLRPSRTVAPEVDSLFSCCSNNFSEAFLAAEGLEAPLLLRQLKERKKQEKDAHAEERRSLQEAQQGVPGIVSSQDCRSKPIRSLTLGDPAFLVESRRSSRTGWRRETGLRSVGLPDLVPGPPKLRRSLTVFGGAGQQYTQGSSKLARAAAKAARELVSFAPKLILGTSQRERSRPLEEQNAETGILEGTPGATRLRAGAQTEDGEKGPAYKENTLLRRAETTSWDMFRRRNDEPEKERCVRVLMETGEKTARAEGERRGTERERREEESPRSRNKHQGNNNNAEEKKQAESVLESPLSCSLYSSLGSEDERGPRNSSEDVASPCPLFCYSNHAVEQLSSSSAKPSIASAPAAFSASLSSSKSPSSSSLYYSPMSSVTGDSRLGTVRPSPPLALSSLPVDGEESSVLHFTELPGNITPDSQDRLPCGSCSLPAFPLSSSSSSQPATGDAGDRSPSSVSPSPKVVLPGSRLAPEERGGNGDSLLSVSFQQGVEKAREQKTAGDVSPRVSARVIENKADDKEDVLGLRKTPLSSEAVKERGSFGHDKNIDSTIEKGGQGVGAAHAASEETNLESSEPPSCRSEKIEGGEQPVPTSQGSSRSTSRFAPGGTLASVLKAPSLSRFPFSGSQSPDFVRSYQGLHGQEWKSKAAPLLSSEPEFDVLRSPPLSHGDEKPRGGADASGAAGSSRLGESSSQYSTQAGEHTAGKSGVRSPEQETGVNPPAALVLPSTAEGQQDAAQQQEESTPRRSLIFREPEKETKSVRAPGEFQRRRGKTASVCMPAWNSPSSRYGQAASQEDQEEKAEGRRQSGNNTDIHASLPTIQVTFADDPAALSGYEDALAVDEDVLTGDLLPIKIHVYPTAFLRNKHIELSIGLLASLLLCAAVSLTYQVFYGED